MPRRQQVQVLCMAAARLQAKHPKNVTEFDHMNRHLSAHVEWCGVVVVVDATTAQEVARSVPGHPTTPTIPT